MRTLAILVLLVGPFLAGCVDSGSPEAATPTPTPEPQFGDIQGLVIDEEFQPVAGAQVFVVEVDVETTTAADGTFAFRDIEAGPVTVRSFEAKHATAESRVVVPADGTVEVELRMPVLPEYAPHNLTTIFDGKFDCAHEVPIWTGDCMILYTTYVGDDPVTEETHEFMMSIGPRWHTVVLEMTWDEPATNQLDGMRLYLEHKNLTSEGHSVKVARADGPESPLRLEIPAGVPHESADVYPGTETPAQLAADGEDALIRVFPRGQFYEYTSQVCDEDGRCFLGVGAGLDIRFTVYATVFYNEPAPDGFTAIPA